MMIYVSNVNEGARNGKVRESKKLFTFEFVFFSVSVSVPVSLSLSLFFSLVFCRFKIDWIIY